MTVDFSQISKKKRGIKGKKQGKQSRGRSYQAVGRLQR